MPPSADFANHLVSRTTFGMDPHTGQAVSDAGWEQWLAAQLDPDRIDDSALEARLAGYRTLDNTNAQNYVIAQTESDGRERITGELHHATLQRALYSRRQLFEVMVEFWNNHFTVFLEDHWARHAKTVDDREVGRTNALGRFADLLTASAHSPAMLVYLDNYISDANDPDGVNENYARELLELHTMGISNGVQPFSESDMQAVALVLSGWSVDDLENGRFLFRPERHHSGPVSVLSGGWSTPGRSGTAGHDDGLSLLDHLAHHGTTARHIAFKLCRRFVADDPPTSIVDSAAAVYLANDTVIAPVLDHIFHSTEFAESAGAKVRRGYEVFTAQARALRADIDPDPLGEASHHIHGAGWGWLSTLGQRAFSHHAPDGYPDTSADWISADALLRRWGTGGTLTGNWADGVNVPHEPLVTPVADRLDDWIDDVAARVYNADRGLPPHGLEDVPRSLDKAVRWAIHERHIGRYPNKTFRPKNHVTRGNVAKMLWSVAGRPTGYPRHGLKDVPRSLDKAVRWAIHERHIGRYPNKTFRPKNHVTRGSIAKMLWSVAGRPTGERSDPLTTEERAAALALFAEVPRAEDESVPDWLVDWKSHDLLTLLVATPRFLRR